MLKAHHRYYNLQLKKIVTVRGEEKDGKVFVSYDGNLRNVESNHLIESGVYDEIRCLSDEEMRDFLNVYPSTNPHDVQLAIAIVKCHGEFNLPETLAYSAFNSPDGKKLSLNDALANLELACDQRGYCG